MGKSFYAEELHCHAEGLQARGLDRGETLSLAQRNAKYCPRDRNVPHGSTNRVQTAWLEALQEGPGQGCRIQCCLHRGHSQKDKGNTAPTHVRLDLGPIYDIYFQTGKSPEKGHFAGGWIRLNPRRSWWNMFAQPGEEESIGEFNCSLLL